MLTRGGENQHIVFLIPRAALEVLEGASDTYVRYLGYSSILAKGVALPCGEGHALSA